MIAKTRAIILRNTNYSESSVISKMYTREFGLRSYIINGVRKGKSAIRPSMIQPISVVEMDIYEKANASINRIKELRNSPLLLNIQGDMVKKTIALFYLEIINQCITEEQLEIELFDFLESEIVLLENEISNACRPIDFLLKLSSYLGVAPQGTYSVTTPYLSIPEGSFISQSAEHCASTNTSKVISDILSANFNCADIKADVRRQSLHFIIAYYQYHITKNKKINSVDILSEILN